LNPDSAFRLSVLQGGIVLRRHLLKYPGLQPEDAIRQLESGPAFLARYDYVTVLEIVKTHGWEAFPETNDFRIALRESLFILAKKLQPFWARMSIFGREKVLKIMGADQEQCLDDAGLLDYPVEAAVLSWWDNLSNFFRGIQDEQQNEIGREAERLTLLYEAKQLQQLGIDKKPIWVAPEDNTIGYDVLSYRSDGKSVFPIYIEVKGTSFRPPHFFMSRQEWEKASGLNTNYFLYIWDVKIPKLLAILGLSAMRLNVPLDQGDGRWTEVECQVLLTDSDK